MLLRERINRLRSEIAANRRLQLGLAVIAVILFAYLLSALFALRSAQEAEFVQHKRQLQKMQALAGQDAWIVRAQSAARMRRALDAEIPAAETIGVAQAQLMTWARDMARSFGGDAVQVQSQTPQRVEGMDALWRIPVVISGAAPPERVMEMIQQIERRSVLTVVDQAMLMNRENETYSLTVVSFAKIGGSRDGNANR